MMMENGFQMMWKEAAVDCFEVLISALVWRGRKKTKNHLRQNSCYTSQDLNQVSPGYKTELLPFELTYSAIKLRPVNKPTGDISIAYRIMAEKPERACIMNLTCHTIAQCPKLKAQTPKSAEKVFLVLIYYFVVCFTFLSHLDCTASNGGIIN
jgi:hypothetical protein